MQEKRFLFKKEIFFYYLENPFGGFDWIFASYSIFTE